jgi:hypothetical protein
MRTCRVAGPVKYFPLILSTALVAACIATWANDQCTGWLAKSHGEGGELKPHSGKSRLVGVLAKLLSGASTPPQVADETEAIVLENPDRLFTDLTSIYFNAVLAFGDEEEAMQRMIGYLLISANLPDAVNTTSSVFEVDLGLGRTPPGLIQPGEVVVLARGEKLCCDLPGWSLFLADNFQGKCYTIPYFYMPCRLFMLN